MPEFTGNVVTGQGLLHEVFHETMKQSFVGLGYPLFEYNQASGQFVNVTNNNPLGFPVRFPRVRYFWDYVHDSTREIGLVNQVFRADPNLVHVVEGSPFIVNAGVRNFLFSLSSPDLPVLRSDTQQSTSNSSSYFMVKSVYSINPKVGVVLAIYFGSQTDAGATGAHGVFRIAYNFSNNSISVPQISYPPYNTAPVWTFPASKVYAFDAGATMEYFVFVLVTNRSNNQTSLWLLRVSYNKANDNISTSAINVLSNVNDATSGLRLPSFPHQDYTDYTADHSTIFSTASLPLPFSLKKGYSQISSTSFSGFVLLQLKGRRPWNFDKVVFIKIPFTANINLSNFSASTVTFSRTQAQVYGPLGIRDIYEEGYMHSDTNRIDFRRSASYSPPTNYRLKISSLNVPWFTSALLVINNDIDESRLSVSTFGWNTTITEYYLANANPYVAIINHELTPGGGVYFTGSTFIDQASIYLGFTVIDGIQHPLLVLGQVWTSDIYNRYTNSVRFRISLVVFDRDVPQGVNWANTVPARNTQPWLCRISNQDFTAYRMSTALSDQEKTVYTLDRDLYITGVMWVGMYQSGFFVPYFQIVRRGGDGVWFDPDTLYVGIASYDPSVFSPSLMIGINGANVFFYRDADDSSNHYILGDQVNLSISLVAKLVTSPDRSSVALVGIQGGNDLKFFRLFFVNPQDNISQTIHYFLPFGSVFLGTSLFNEHVVPFALTFPQLPYGARPKGKNSNFLIYKDDLHRIKVFLAVNNQAREISLSSQTSLPVGGNLAAPIPVILYEAFGGVSTMEGVFSRAVFSLNNPVSALRGVDFSRTLRVGDYVTFTDAQGNTYEYVVVHQYDDTYYNSLPGTGTSTYRSLLLVRR